MSKNNVQNESIELELTRAAYWQHFKADKDLGDYLPHNHPRRIKIRKIANELQLKIQVLDQKNKNF